ncbi:hypothetical protein PNA2_0917 [Pyrococcus sp. NA2]|uniref:hypothetical protein n=1 Tax=Pyrococcus sp. (strain NA2) TaxID=342949 RepID=UPI000209B060|nr:hypothetical protein [Pyrococcus sp. NA2]AEC51834.1 hypothetical protein PNA2_0917 [Pyrococcus sp. NA2]
MKVKVVFPRERRLFHITLRVYVMFLLVASSAMAVLLLFNALQYNLVSALIHLVAFALFLTSALMYKDLYMTLKRSRFTTLWTLFSRYSPPFGAYALLYILTAVLFYIADLVHGGYFVLALTLTFRGIFEHRIGRLMNDLRACSYLYFSVISGESDMLLIKDPFM